MGKYYYTLKVLWKGYIVEKDVLSTSKEIVPSLNVKHQAIIKRSIHAEIDMI